MVANLPIYTPCRGKPYRAMMGTACVTSSLIVGYHSMRDTPRRVTSHHVTAVCTRFHVKLRGAVYVSVSLNHFTSHRGTSTHAKPPHSGCQVMRGHPMPAHASPCQPTPRHTPQRMSSHAGVTPYQPMQHIFSSDECNMVATQQACDPISPCTHHNGSMTAERLTLG